MGKFDDIIDEFEEGLIEKEKINLVAFIMDASGSMNGSEKFVCDSFNEQLEIAKKQEDQETLITLVRFNTSANFQSGSFFDHTPVLEVRFVNRHVKKVEKIKNWEVDGGTPLYDAIGHTISKLKQTIEDYKDKDISVLIVVITDGAENSSKEYNGQQIKNMVEELEGQGNWTFTFLGADIDAFSESNKMSFSLTNTMSINKNSHDYTRATKKMSDGLGKFFSARTMGEKSIRNYYGDDEEKK